MAQEYETRLFPGNFYGIRQANLDRLDYFGHGNLKDGCNYAEWGCALGGECVELLNVLKKMHRAASFDPDYDVLLKQAAEEIGDVLLSLDLVAAKLELDLLSCAANKFNLTSSIKGMPQRIDYPSL